MKLTDELLNAFLNDHWEDHRSINARVYAAIAKEGKFIYSGQVFRGVISTEEAFNLDFNFQVNKGWSKTEQGVINFISHEVKDQAYESMSDLVYIIEGEIEGIDISKIISYLKERGTLESTSQKLFDKEEEVILTSPIQATKLSSYSLKEFISLIKI